MNKNGLHTNENHSENLDYLSDYIYRGLYKRGTIKIVFYLWPNFQLSFTSQGRNHPVINSLQLNPCPIVELLKWVTKRWTIFIPDLKWSIRNLLCQCAFTTAWRFRDNVPFTIIRHSFYCGFHSFSMEVSRSMVFASYSVSTLCPHPFHVVRRLVSTARVEVSRGVTWSSMREKPSTPCPHFPHSRHSFSCTVCQKISRCLT